MKKERFKLRVKPRKSRRKWLINPRTRVHDELEYKRGQAKKEERKIIEEELRKSKGGP